MKVSFKIVLVCLAGLLVVGGLGYGGYRLWQQYHPAGPKQPTDSAIVDKSYITTKTAAEQGWNVLSDSLYNFTLEYPKDWVVKDFTETPAEPKDWSHAVGFRSPDTSGVQGYWLVHMFVYDNPEHLSLPNWYEKYDFEHTSSSPVEPNAELAGEQAIFFYNTGEGSIGTAVAILANQGNIYIFKYDAFNNGADYPSFVRMLETFEFEGKKTVDNIPVINPEDLKFKG